MAVGHSSLLLTVGLLRTMALIKKSTKHTHLRAVISIMMISPRQHRPASAQPPTPSVDQQQQQQQKHQVEECSLDNEEAPSTTTRATAQATYIITYFEFRARSEILKLICLEGKLNFKLRVESYPNWPRSDLFKDSPFGHLPVLQIEGDSSFMLAQTLAISMYLCRRCGLLPHDEMEQALVHSLVNEVSDVRAHTDRIFLQSGTSVCNHVVLL